MFALYKHYYQVAPLTHWTFSGTAYRPDVYLNTGNHMIGPLDGNAQFVKHVWHAYPVIHGSRHQVRPALLFIFYGLPSPCMSV